MNKESVQAIIANLEQAQKQRELGFKIPPFLTPEEHLMVIAYWRLQLEKLDKNSYIGAMEHV